MPTTFRRDTHETHVRLRVHMHVPVEPLSRRAVPRSAASISIQRNILRAPLYNSLAEENYVDTRPPDWEGHTPQDS